MVTVYLLHVMSILTEGTEGLYEIALLKGDKLHYDNEWTDVRGYLTKAEVWNWLKIVSEY